MDRAKSRCMWGRKRGPVLPAKRGGGGGSGARQLHRRGGGGWRTIVKWRADSWAPSVSGWRAGSMARVAGALSWADWPGPELNRNKISNFDIFTK
jgi:hypothetical protein